MTRAAAIVTKNDKVALIHRNRGDDVFYLFPGGQVEDNESTEQAAIREIHEELGLTIAVDRLVAVVSRNGAEQYHFSATILGGEFGTGEGAEMGSYTAVWLPISGLARQSVRPLQLARLVVAAHERGWPADPIRFNEMARPPETVGEHGIANGRLRPTLPDRRPRQLLSSGAEV